MSNPSDSPSYAYLESPYVLERGPGTLDVLGVGYNERGGPSAAFTERRSARRYALLYIVGGAGWYSDRKVGRRPIRGGDLVVLTPTTPCRLHSRGRPAWREHWVAFTGSIADQWRGTLIPSGRPVTRVGPHEGIVSLYRELASTMRYRLDGYRERSALLVHRILVAFHMRRQSQTQSTTLDSVQKVIRAMHAAHREPFFDIHDLCTREDLSYERVRKQFRQRTGVSPHRYFIAIKLAEARNLLTSRREMKVKEIATHLGFEDPYYFSRLFSRHEGISPREYREKFRMV